MEENNKAQSPDAETSADTKPAYTPATKKQRMIAWAGVVFMIIVTLGYTFYISTGTNVWEYFS